MATTPTTPRRGLLAAFAGFALLPFLGARLAGAEPERWRGIKYHDGRVGWWLTEVGVSQDGEGRWMWGPVEDIHLPGNPPTKCVTLDHGPYDDRHQAMTAALDSLG